MPSWGTVVLVWADWEHKLGSPGVKIGGRNACGTGVGQLGQRWDRAFLSAVPATTRAVVGFQRYWDRGTDVFT